MEGLCGLVAKGLSMMDNKVAVGGNNYMKRMVISEEDVSGPEFATPVGIAITAMNNRNNRKYSVTLNGRMIQIVAREPANIMELLLLNGYERNQLLGRSGQSTARRPASPPRSTPTTRSAWSLPSQDRTRP